MNKISTKTIARIATVQALYQYQINGDEQSVNELIQGIVTYYADTDLEVHDDLDLEASGSLKIKLNINYFTTLINYALDHLKVIDTMIEANMGAGWTVEHLHTTLMAVLRAAICELKFFPEVPYKVIINEFTDIASDMLKANEVAFVNSILDKISISLRGDVIDK
ncbi:MAG: transcription antitermination factor NusB [Pseudomonadota bacterium]